MLSRFVLIALGLVADAAWLSALLAVLGWTISLQASLIPLWAVLLLLVVAFVAGRAAPTYALEDGAVIDGRWRVMQGAGGAIAAYVAAAAGLGASSHGLLWPIAVLSGNATGSESVAVVGSLLAALLLWRRGVKSGLEGFARERFQDVFRWGSISIAFAAAADAACGCGLLDYRIATLFFVAGLSGLALSQLPADDGKASFWFKVVGAAVVVVLCGGAALGLLGSAYGSAAVVLAGELWRGAVTLFIDAVALVLGPALEWIFSFVEWFRGQLGDGTNTIRPTDLSALRDLGPKTVRELDGDTRNVVQLLMLALLGLVLYKGFLLGFRGRFRRFVLRSGDERESVANEENAMADLADLLTGLLPEWMRPGAGPERRWPVPKGPPEIVNAFELYFAMLEQAINNGWQFDPARTPRERLDGLSETLGEAPVTEITETFNLACYAGIAPDPARLSELRAALGG